MDEMGLNEVYCRWCGEGGMLCLCDSCPKAFCSACIQQNFGLPEITRIQGLQERWSCFICAPQAIQDLAERIIPLYGEKFAPKRAKKALPPLPKHVVCADISGGREKYEIRAFNDVDDQVPNNFVYVTKYVGNYVTNNPSFLSCCTCTDNCQDPEKCECAQLMGKKFAYNEDGVLMKDLPGGVYECNARCSCHVGRCKNRVVGNGPRVKLEVFRCADKDKGWGVRALQHVPHGTFIADYLGEVMPESITDLRGFTDGDEYVFNLDQWGNDVGCGKLSALGMKRGLAAMPREVDVDVNTLSRAELDELIGKEITEKLDEKGALERARTLGRERAAGRSITSLVPSPARGRSPVGRKRPLGIVNASGGVTLFKDGTAEPSSSSSSSSSSGAADGGPGCPPAGGGAASGRRASWYHSRREPRVAAWAEGKKVIVDRSVNETEQKHDTYTIDAQFFGSVGRFLNHSCSPNLTKTMVFVDSHDARMPRVAFFANGDIEPMTELCYDYGYSEGKVEGREKIKCLCGAPNCTTIFVS